MMLVELQSHKTKIVSIQANDGEVGHMKVKNKQSSNDTWVHFHTKTSTSQTKRLIEWNCKARARVDCPTSLTTVYCTTYYSLLHEKQKSCAGKALAIHHWALLHPAGAAHGEDPPKGCNVQALVFLRKHPENHQSWPRQSDDTTDWPRHDKNLRGANEDSCPKLYLCDSPQMWSPLRHSCNHHHVLYRWTK